MTRQTILARGRAKATEGFIDTCVIKRVSAVATNPLDGTVTYTHTQVYPQPGDVGVCRFQQAAAPWAGPAEVGQAQVGLSALEIQLPVVGSEGITRDDIVTCLTCVNDTDLVGRVFVVQGAHHASEKTTRRLPLQETLS